MVRYDENKQKQDTGVYRILGDNNGSLPIISSVDDVSNTFSK